MRQKREPRPAKDDAQKWSEITGISPKFLVEACLHQPDTNTKKDQLEMMKRIKQWLWLLVEDLKEV